MCIVFALRCSCCHSDISQDEAAGGELLRRESAWGIWGGCLWETGSFGSSLFVGCYRKTTQFTLLCVKSMWGSGKLLQRSLSLLIQKSTFTWRVSCSPCTQLQPGSRLNWAIRAVTCWISKARINMASRGLTGLWLTDPQCSKHIIIGRWCKVGRWDSISVCAHDAIQKVKSAI